MSPLVNLQAELSSALKQKIEEDKEGDVTLTISEKNNFYDYDEYT